MNNQIKGVLDQEGIHLEKSVIVLRPQTEIYHYWRKFDHLPLFMSLLKRVEVKTSLLSSWTVEGPLGAEFSWDAEIINEHTGSLIAWQSLPGSQVRTAGSVRFDALGEGQTKVTLNLKYDPPGGYAGLAIAALLLENPEERIVDDLYRFKKLMENSVD